MLMYLDLSMERSQHTISTSKLQDTEYVLDQSSLHHILRV